MERNHEDEWSLHAGSGYLGTIDKFFFSFEVLLLINRNMYGQIIPMATT